MQSNPEESHEKIIISLLLLILNSSLFTNTALAQNNTALEAQDILQLINAYPHLLDNCINGGDDYADQFTDDATFGVSSEWGKAKIWFRGREQMKLASAGIPYTGKVVMKTPLKKPGPFALQIPRACLARNRMDRQT